MIDEKMAGGAVKAALRQLNVDDLSLQDWEDLRQEALIALWRTAYRFGDEDAQRRYSFGAAVREVKKAYFVQILGRGPVASSLWEERTHLLDECDDPGKELPLEVIEALAEIFIAARVHTCGRAVEAAWRDVAICALVYAGYGNQEIGEMLGIPAPHVRKYRQKIRVVLSHYAEEARL
jgi:DNA-directed RNA polymerase specialized sigma24 family protein